MQQVGRQCAPPAKGHFSSQCFSKSVASVNSSSPSSETEYDTAYLNAVTSGSNAKTWTCEIMVDGQNVPFKIDTGAKVTVITELVAKQLQPKKLLKSWKNLCGPVRKSLTVLSELTVSLTYKGTRSIQNVYVVEGLQENLLGLSAIQALGILHVAQVLTVKQSINDCYPSLFTGLGTFAEGYAIKLRPDAKPFSLFTPRNVPLPLRKKVSDELARMERLGVISKANKPTDWCAGMAVVPKKSGDIRICVDF